MAGSRTRVPRVGYRFLMGLVDGGEFADNGKGLADMDLDFFEEGDSLPESYCISKIDIEDDSDYKERNEQSDADRKAFWESQHHLLYATLSRSSSVESRIRQATRVALKEPQLVGTICVCQRPVTAQGCRSCLRKDISDRLWKAGFNSAICKSKWKKTASNVPSGEHSYIDVLDNSSNNKGEVRVVIELNFRAEFVMAIASEEYNRLVNGLPEVFVGKAERLSKLIKIVCSAAKKCMKENKMHMGPWRKHKYMHAKWFGTCERTVYTATPLSSRLPSKLRIPRSSMLTSDLLEKMPSLHCTAVEVL